MKKEFNIISINPLKAILYDGNNIDEVVKFGLGYVQQEPRLTDVLEKPSVVLFIGDKHSGHIPVGSYVIKEGSAIHSMNAKDFNESYRKLNKVE